jgi:aspartyl-tRNA(Asn)/glutamyl-tRNA(Gln) amidotransferase subunit A
VHEVSLALVTRTVLPPSADESSCAAGPHQMQQCTATCVFCAIRHGAHTRVVAHTSFVPCFSSLQGVPFRSTTRRGSHRAGHGRVLASAAQAPAPASPHSVLRTLQHQLHTKQRSSVEVTDAYLAAIQRSQSTLNAFTTVCSDLARAQAQAADARRTAGTALGPLDGIPVSVKVRACAASSVGSKRRMSPHTRRCARLTDVCGACQDNLCTRGVATTAGSRVLSGYVPPYDATSWARLSAAGAVLLGKTNMDEFGMGSSTERSAYGHSANPWDVARVPGGSSGGAAAAVAANLCAAALGSDTGGSVRQPAAFCGAVGLKPTYGRVSRSGLIAYASSLDVVGTLTTSVEDAALLLGVIAGRDPADATTADVAVPDFCQVRSKRGR